MEMKQTNQYKKLKCPLCERLLFKVDNNCICSIQIKCTKCSNILNLEINKDKVHFKNEKIECNKLI